MAECRIGLKLSQAELAQLCGYTREQQGRFERDVNHPGSEYLLRAAEHGVDISYVLTGAPGAMNAEELELLQRFRSADAEGKRKMLGVAL